jgi:hypothetical protein
MFIPYAKNIFFMKLTQENTNEVIYKNRPIVACISLYHTRSCIDIQLHI